MRVAIRFRAKTKLIMHTDYPKFIGMPAVRTDGGRSVYGHVITKFSGMGRLPLAMKLRPRARAKRARGAPLLTLSAILTSSASLFQLSALVSKRVPHKIKIKFGNTKIKTISS